MSASYIVVIAPTRQAPAGALLIGWRAEGPFAELDEAQSRRRRLTEDLADLDMDRYWHARVLTLDPVPCAVA